MCACHQPQHQPPSNQIHSWQSPPSLILSLLGESSHWPSVKSPTFRLLQTNVTFCAASSRRLLLWQRRTTAMVSIQSRWRYLFMFLGIQLVVMALLSREGYQKRVSYFIRIFRKPDSTGRNHTVAGVSGGDVYANLSHLSKAHHHGDDMPFCPKTSPFIRECSCLLLCHSIVPDSTVLPKVDYSLSVKK